MGLSVRSPTHCQCSLLSTVSADPRMPGTITTGSREGGGGPSMAAGPSLLERAGPPKCLEGQGRL
eukprot:2165554-Pyramimonas_sp.AAC.1